jgi:hypothetical protein
LGGLVLMTLGMSRRRAREREPVFRVGEARGSDYPISLPARDPFELVYGCSDSGFMLQCPEGWRVDLHDNEGSIDFPEPKQGLRRTALPLEFQGQVQFGAHRFSIRSTSAARKQALPMLAALDSRYLAFLGGTAAVFLALVMLLDNHFQEEKSLYSEVFDRSPRIANNRIVAKEKPPLRFALARGYVAGPLGGRGKSMSGASGVMGKRNSERATGRYAMQEREPVPQLARGRVLQEAREAGILGVIRQQQSFASLTSVHSISSGHDAEDVYGGLLGNQVGEMAGGWGYSIVGVGTGADGTEFGTIGSGRYGTIGHGSGTGSGWGAGAGIGMRGHQDLMPGVRIGNADAIGDMDKNIIRRYIRRKLPRFKHCYERALIGDQELAGSIETTFQITPQGAVQAVKVTGMDEAEMHDCVGETLKSIEFPKPKGGGYVSVRYPFTFAATH